MIRKSSSSPFGQPFCSETFRRIPWSALLVLMLMLACFYTCYNCHGRIICRSETRNYRKTNSSIDVLFSPDRTTDNAQECGFIQCSCSQFFITRSMFQNDQKERHNMRFWKTIVYIARFLISLLYSTTFMTILCKYSWHKLGKYR